MDEKEEEEEEGNKAQMDCSALTAVELIAAVAAIGVPVALSPDVDALPVRASELVPAAFCVVHNNLFLSKKMSFFL